MKALIDPRFERVAQIEDAEFPVAAPLFWVDAPAGITTQHTYDGTFHPPPPDPAPPLPEDTPLTPVDVERLFLSLPGVTKEKIKAAKRDRGKPLP